MPDGSRFRINRDLLVYKAFYFFFLSSFGSVFPYLPVYFRQIGLSAIQVGLLVGMRPIVQFASAPFWAIVADKYRKRKSVLVMSVLAWLIMTISLAFVEPTNELCELRAGSGSHMRIVNHTKVKTGFFKRSLLAVQEEFVNTGEVERSPDLIVVPVATPRPKLSIKFLDSEKKAVIPPGLGPNRSAFSSSVHQKFVHDKASSLHSYQTGRHLSKTRHRENTASPNSRNLVGDKIAETLQRNVTSAKKSGKAIRHISDSKHHFASHGKKSVPLQRRKYIYHKTATRIGQLVNKLRNNTSKSSALSETKNMTQVSNGYNKEVLVDKVTRNSSRSSASARSLTVNKLDTDGHVPQEQGDKSQHHSINKPQEARKSTRNEKSSSPPIVIEFSRIPIPQNRGGKDLKPPSDNPKEHNSEDNESIAKSHAEINNADFDETADQFADFSSGIEESNRRNNTTASRIADNLSVTDTKITDASEAILRSTLQRKRPFSNDSDINQTIADANINYGGLNLNDLSPDEEGPSETTLTVPHSKKQQKEEFGSGNKELVLQGIDTYSFGDHNRDDVGEQSVQEDSLHKEEFQNMSTKVVHHTNNLFLGLGTNVTSGGKSGTIIDEPDLSSKLVQKEISGTELEQKNATIRIGKETISKNSKDPSSIGDQKAALRNTTESSSPATAVFSSKSHMKIQITNIALKNGSAIPAAIHLVTEQMSDDEDATEANSMGETLLSTRNLLKENTSELKRIFTILLVLIVVGEFLEAPSFTLADASLLEHLGEERRFYGKQRLWGSLGFGIFSFLVGALLERSRHVVCGEQYTDYMICFCVFAIFMVMTLFVSTTFQFKYNETKVEHTSVMYSLCNIHYGSCLVAACFMGVGHGMSHNFVNWFLEDLGGTKTLMGIAVICRCTADLMTFFLAGSLIKYVGQIRIMAVCLFSYGLSFTAYSLLSNPWWVLPVEVLNGVTYAASWSACTSYMAEAVSSDAVTTVQGLSILFKKINKYPQIPLYISRKNAAVSGLVKNFIEIGQVFLKIYSPYKV